MLNAQTVEIRIAVFERKGNQDKSGASKFGKPDKPQGFHRFWAPKKFTNEIQSIPEFGADGTRAVTWEDVERPKVG